MIRDEVLALLECDQVSAAIRWAFESACEQALADFARGTGYTALSAGVGRYDLIADRLDRVFSCRDYAVPDGLESAGLDVLYEGLSEKARTTMPRVKPGTVIRSNLNGSNGWSYRGLRFITHSVQLCELNRIDWTQESKTKKAVARQQPASPAIPTLLDSILTPTELADLALQDALPEVGVPTFVLVHALDRDSSDRELVFGHSRYNDDDGAPWNWHESLLGGHKPETTKQPLPNWTPNPSHVAPDVPVRLRQPAADRKTQ